MGFHCLVSGNPKRRNLLVRLSLKKYSYRNVCEEMDLFQDSLEHSLSGNGLGSHARYSHGSVPTTYPSAHDCTGPKLGSGL